MRRVSAIFFAAFLVGVSADAQDANRQLAARPLVAPPTFGAGEREIAIARIVERWSLHAAEQGYPPNEWQDQFVSMLRTLDSAGLERAQVIDSYDRIVELLTGSAPGRGRLGEVTGSAALAGAALSSDFNFVAITPCRILDSRLGTGAFAGPYPAGAVVNISTGLSSRVPQGGQACPGFDTKSLARPDIHPAALAFTVTVVDYAGNGYVTTFPFSAPMPRTSTINFGPGTVPTPLATGSVVGTCVMCGSEVSIAVAGSPTNVIIDLTGYFDRTLTGSDSGPPLVVTSAVAGDNYMFSGTSILPLRNLTCTVTSDVTWANNGANETGTGTMKTAMRLNLIAPTITADTGWENHVGSNHIERGSASKSWVYNLISGETGGHVSQAFNYSFGCDFIASNDFVGDLAACSVTWTCR